MPPVLHLLVQSWSHTTAGARGWAPALQWPSGEAVISHEGARSWFSLLKSHKRNRQREAAAGEHWCHSSETALQIYPTPTPRTGTMAATSPESTALRAGAPLGAVWAVAPTEPRLPLVTSPASSSAAAAPEPVDVLWRAREANSLTFTNPSSLSPQCHFPAVLHPSTYLVKSKHPLSSSSQLSRRSRTGKCEV